MSSDRDHIISELPKEIVGGTYILRPQDQITSWLPYLAIKTKKDGTAYIMIQTKYAGKEQISEVDESLLEKDGWKPVEGKMATAPGAGSAWKVFKKDVKEGEIILELENMKWEKKAPVLFVFK